jgi:hypothetical protein
MKIKVTIKSNTYIFSKGEIREWRDVFHHANVRSAHRGAVITILIKGTHHVGT